ncbi:MBL fold metallo-hydrolase [Synergistaceae bacterium OttesenSCG-928-I11]|nr:MBL fold metallo-hydrolase [Synergistaceae bacterium OttesenSCG-928-I11]
MKLDRFALGMLWTNCYVLSSRTGDAVVVDPGGPTEEVRQYLNEENLRLQWVLLTHGHGDHIFGVGELRTLASRGVAICEEDAPCLVSSGENLSRHMGQKVELEPADRLLKDGDVLTVGDMKIEVIATPGHTRGGCCYYTSEGDEAVLLSGDTLFARSIGRSDLPGGDEATLLASLGKLTGFPDSLKVYPGHGPSTTIGEERSLNPFWPR